MIKIFFIVNFISYAVMAQALLVPEKSVPLSDYLQACQQPGYICTHDFFKNKILSSTTSKYDIFLEQLNLDQPSQLKDIDQNIKTLLKEEDVDIDQVENLISILEKAKSLTQINYQILIDLLELTAKIRQPDHFSVQPEEYYIVFKFPLSKEKFNEIRLLANQFKNHRITPYTNSSHSLDAVDYLIVGTCDQHIISNHLQKNSPALHFQKMFTDSCSWSDKFSKAAISTSDFVKKNNKAIFWSAVALTAVLFLNKYQLTLSY